MTESYRLKQPENAEEFLAMLPPSTRRKGEEYFQQGKVVNLKCQQSGTSFAADVDDGLWSCHVEIFYNEEDGWDANCSCPAEYDCKHVYAATKSLLAEHTAACVRNLSAGTQATPAKKPVATDRPAGLAGKLSAALQRSLRKEEAAYVRKVVEVYRRCCNARGITGWDFAELALHLSGPTWNHLQIWPSFPKDEHDFWLYVANAALEHQRPIPEFMEPVTDLGLIRDRLEKWKRAREIDRWRQMLQNAGRELDLGPIAIEQIDLRLKLMQDRAALEWRRAGTDQYEVLKQSQYRRLETDYDAGAVELTGEGELIWQGFRQNYEYGGSLHQLHYDKTDDKQALARLLRLKGLAERIVNERSQPFIRASEPLRWSLTLAENEHENYGFHLVQADGTPAPHCLVALPGRPALYVTETTVFTGPPTDNSVLDPRQENLIPAPAVESPAGIEFLGRLGVDLPPRLRDRVRRVPMRVKISCALQESYPGSTTELCKVEVGAQSEDGAIQETWVGSSWQPARAQKAATRSKEKDKLFTVYDRSDLDALPRLMQPLGLKWEAYLGILSMRVTKKFPETFVPWLKSIPPHIEVQLDGELASLANDPIAAQVKLDVTEVNVDWFDLQVVLNVSDTELSPDELKLLLDAKGRYVRLGDKGWRRMEFNLDEEEDERLARLGLNPRELSSEPQRLHALQLADPAASRFLPEQQVAQIQRRAAEIKATVTPDLPAQLRADLRPYQREGFNFLAYLSTNGFGGILADDMGLGKTVQTLAWLAWLHEQSGQRVQAATEVPLTPERAGPPVPAPPASAAPLPPAKPTLVVCPKSVMDIWRSEAERFTPDLRVKVWNGGDIDQFFDRLAEADLHVLNYTQLRLVGESLAPVSWLAVILDEGQYIKNPNSQTAQVARALRADYRLVLSGTPIENKLLDLWSLMAFAMPGVLGSRAQFARLYDQKGDPFARRRLAARVRPFLLRRTKTQVAKDLPDRVEEDLLCEIEGEQKALYRAELKRAQQLLLRVQTQQQLAKERFHVLTSLLRLRQICCHPTLVNANSRAESAKVNALLEQLEPLMEEGHKVLVFSQFVTMLDLLRPILKEKGWPMFYLAGETENRGALVQEFQAAAGAAVFLISLKAGGFGLNLTAASYVVLFDPWWNPAVENQAIDRTHRIGQANKVIAYRLLIKDSIEEKIRALQKQKSAIAEDVLGEEKFAQALTLDDLRFLFAD